MQSLGSFRSAPLVAGLLACSGISSAAAQGPLDEAQRAGRSESSLPQASEDFFNAIDDLGHDEKAFGKEPALRGEDKSALIASLKTF